MKLERIYKVALWYTIVSAIPYKETNKHVIFLNYSDATNNRRLMPKFEYAQMARSPQEAIDQHRASLTRKIGKLKDEIDKLNILEQEIKND